MRACVRACVRASVRARARACVAYMSVCACVHLFVKSQEKAVGILS